MHMCWLTRSAPIMRSCGRSPATASGRSGQGADPHTQNPHLGTVAAHVAAAAGAARLEFPQPHPRTGPGRSASSACTPAIHLPGVITSGTFQIDGERVFWDVSDPANAFVIELADERHARLILQVDDPRSTVALIESTKGG